MEFCPNCGSIMNTKIIETGSQAMLLLQCTRCGYKKRETNNHHKIALKTINHNPKQMVAVIDKEGDLSTEATVSIECPVCGNKTGYIWQVQTRGADESSTQFIRCTECGYTYRENT